ncbi:hypothetical protein [Streptomyces alfalfae]
MQIGKQSEPALAGLLQQGALADAPRTADRDRPAAHLVELALQRGLDLRRYPVPGVAGVDETVMTAGHQQ